MNLPDDIEVLASAADVRPDLAWPAAMLERVVGWGWRRWLIGEEHGGAPLPPDQLLARYRALGAADVALALIVTQHDGAVELLSHGDNAALKDRHLPALARGDIGATLGISQLTTSRRSGPAAIRIESAAGGFRLDGVMPWVTGADHASHIVTGGVLAGGQQLLALVPTDRDGLQVQPPARMLAVDSSHTSEVRCDGVVIKASEVIRGPVAKALASRAPTKALVVSSVGIGLAGSMLASIRRHVAAEPAFADVVLVPFERELARITERLHTAGERLPVSDKTKVAIRVAVNTLLSRAAIALVTVAKGSGTVLGMRAQRLVREALFLQVWSAPSEVRLAALRPLLPGAGAPALDG